MREEQKTKLLFI